MNYFNGIMVIIIDGTSSLLSLSLSSKTTNSYSGFDGSSMSDCANSKTKSRASVSAKKNKCLKKNQNVFFLQLFIGLIVVNDYE